MLAQLKASFWLEIWNCLKLSGHLNSINRGEKVMSVCDSLDAVCQVAFDCRWIEFCRSDYRRRQCVSTILISLKMQPVTGNFEYFLNTLRILRILKAWLMGPQNARTTWIGNDSTESNPFISGMLRDDRVIIYERSTVSELLECRHLMITVIIAKID